MNQYLETLGEFYLQPYKRLTQQRFYTHFLAISAIPRESGNEKAVSDYVASFGRKLGLEVEQDVAKNVIIRKPASKGQESSPPLILQGHLDMVCEKELDSAHDFGVDPITPFERDGFIMANRTTLGADNGVAVAYAMAVLEAEDLVHPPIEAVFTTSEETGMDGIYALNAESLKATRMLNLDSEEENAIYTSCAGGVRFEMGLPVSVTAPAKDSLPMRLSIQGLTGGHSGVDIGRERANALLLLARLLDELRAEITLQISAFSGGAKDNAIPRHAEATIWVSQNAAEKARAFVAERSAVIAQEYAVTEPGLMIGLEPSSTAHPSVWDEDSLNRCLSALLLIPNGVFAYNPLLPGVLDFSSNLGIVSLSESSLHLTGLVRSNTNSKMEAAIAKLHHLAQILGADFRTGCRYPAWEYRPDSALRDLCTKVFQERYGEEMAVSSIHGGLECAIMADKRPDMDMVSFGPNLFDVHTPQERVEIASLLRVWDYLTALLARL